MSDAPPRAILETCIYGEDLSAMERFYRRVMGLEPFLKEAGRHVFFRCGSGVLLIFNPATTSTSPTSVNGAPIPLHGATGPGHLAFAVPASELTSWRERLLRERVEIESEVDWPAGGHSIYFRDPAGNSVELAPPAIWGLPE